MRDYEQAENNRIIKTITDRETGEITDPAILAQLSSYRDKDGEYKVHQMQKDAGSESWFFDDNSDDPLVQAAQNHNMWLHNAPLREIARRLEAGDFKVEMASNMLTSAPTIDISIGDEYYRATIYLTPEHQGVIWLQVGYDYHWFLRPVQFDQLITDMREREIGSMGGELLQDYWRQYRAYEREAEADPEGAFGGRGNNTPFASHPGQSVDVRDHLAEIITTAEAAALYGIEPITVIKNIERGNIPGRKSGKTWLIRRADAEARWGKK